MVEIRTTLEAFRKLASKSGNPIFESKGVVVTTTKGMTILAAKSNPQKIYPKVSYPLTRLGYSGIASSDWKGMCFEDILDGMNLEELSIEELTQVQSKIKDILKETKE